MPWHKEVIKKADVSYPLEGINHFMRTNEINKKGIEKWGRFRYISNKVKYAQ